MDWRNVGCMTIPKETTEEELAVCLFDILVDPTDDPIRRACKLLGHSYLGSPGQPVSQVIHLTKRVL